MRATQHILRVLSKRLTAGTLLTLACLGGCLLRRIPIRSSLNYMLREFQDRWRIIDGLLDARYCELAKQRAEFAAVLRSGGVSDLIATLERKIAQLTAEG